MDKQRDKYQLVEMKDRYYGGREMPEVTIVDLRGVKGKSWSPISETLKEGLERVLAEGGQAIIFINRRGSASAVQCLDCGKVMECPHCEMPFTRHGFSDRARLICHYCGRVEMPQSKCSNCGGVRLFPVGSGTQSVERALQEFFPKANVRRADRDTTGKKEAHDEIYEKMKNGEIDILVGTQMIAKGLDLPEVQLVGVILADFGLHRPDFRAAENVFQLITQVAGRAGRREKRGEVVVQTFSPEHFAIRAGAQHDFDQFYQSEIQRRKEGGWPPESRVVKLEVKFPDKEKTYNEALRVFRMLKDLVDKKGLDLEILGPSPSLPPRIAGRYRWQILIRGENPREGIEMIDIGKEWRIDVDPI